MPGKFNSQVNVNATIHFNARYVSQDSQTIRHTPDNESSWIPFKSQEFIICDIEKKVQHTFRQLTGMLQGELQGYGTLAIIL